MASKYGTKISDRRKKETEKKEGKKEGREMERNGYPDAGKKVFYALGTRISLLELCSLL
jgi:hypothetical protein